MVKFAALNQGQGVWKLMHQLTFTLLMHTLDCHSLCVCSGSVLSRIFIHSFIDALARLADQFYAQCFLSFPQQNNCCFFRPFFSLALSSLVTSHFTLLFWPRSMLTFTFIPPFPCHTWAGFLSFSPMDAVASTMLSRTHTKYQFWRIGKWLNAFHLHRIT